MSPKAPTFGEYPFQALCPGHGLVALFGCFVFVFLSDAAFAAFGGVTSTRCLLLGATKSPGAILNSFKLARRVEGRTPGIIHRGTGSGLLSVSAPVPPAWQ